MASNDILLYSLISVLFSYHWRRFILQQPATDTRNLPGKPQPRGDTQIIRKRLI